MEKELRAFTDGTYVFAETENDHQFYFYRQDNQELGEVGRIPMDMYQNYICMKMFSGEVTETVMSNIEFSRSKDDKCIRLTTYNIGEKINPLKESEPKGIKKLVKSLFGKPKKY